MPPFYYYYYYFEVWLICSIVLVSGIKLMEGKTVLQLGLLLSKVATNDFSILSICRCWELYSIKNRHELCLNISTHHLPVLPLPHAVNDLSL